MTKQQEIIPVAVAQVVANAATAPTAPSSNSGKQGKVRPSLKQSKGSSKVLMPKKDKSILNEEQIRALQKQGFTRGLAEAMSANNAAFPLRIWIIDNSGSMAKTDGNRIVQKRNNEIKMVQCTRWKEIQECVTDHAQMAGLLQVPTVFRLLNPPGNTGHQQFSVAERGEELIDDDLHVAMTSMRSQPHGLTPLTSHIREIRKNIVDLEPSLKESGSRVVVVIATDGLPTSTSATSANQAEKEFVEALRSLEGLPCWVVIRLCTDDESIVDFYNELDDQLELSLDVLDDFRAEAAEVYEHNPFLNYTLQIHRCREAGFSHRTFDLLDNQSLSIDELFEFFELLFGSPSMDGVPDPQVDWNGFLVDMKRIVEREEYQWNPITKRVEPWININKLNKAFGGGIGCGGPSGGGCAPGCSIM